MTLNISLYGIVDPQIGRGRSLGLLGRAAADAGMTLLQYRAKALDTRSMVAEARAIKAALDGTNVPLLINDRIDVALAAGADGVHIGNDDMTPEDARALLGPKAIIGSTVKSAADVDRLVGAPIDYICIGGVFATSHKDNPDPPLGVAAFAKLAAYARTKLGAMPIGAIAGIDASNAGNLIKAGADGVAVIGALFAGDDVAASTGIMAQAISKARQP
ncbi:MAG: thiamine phosphate synthase [Beijerinckiaceae bacterium]